MAFGATYKRIRPIANRCIFVLLLISFCMTALLFKVAHFYSMDTREYAHKRVLRTYGDIPFSSPEYEKIKAQKEKYRADLIAHKQELNARLDRWFKIASPAEYARKRLKEDEIAHNDSGGSYKSYVQERSKAQDTRGQSLFALHALGLLLSLMFFHYKSGLSWINTIYSVGFFITIIVYLAKTGFYS